MTPSVSDPSRGEIWYARFDPIALTVPVALVFELDREKQ